MGIARRDGEPRAIVPPKRAARRPSMGWPARRFEPLEDRRALATVSLFPVADNTLYENATGALSNGAGVSLFAGVTTQTSGAIRRAVLRFDVSSEVPPGAVIDDVDLTLHVSKTISGDRELALYALLAEWGEGTSDAALQEGSGGASTTDSATWKHRFFPNTNWTNLGGDFASQPSATLTVGAPGSYTWSDPRMIDDVQKWVDQPTKQFGWLLKATNETERGSAKRFDSRQASPTSVRPVLTVQYTESGPVNKAPGLDPIGAPPPVLEDSGEQLMELTGINAGADEQQVLTVTATSSDPGIVPHPLVHYASPSATATLRFQPARDAFGAVTITVTVQDDGGTARGGIDRIERQFDLNILPVNDEPKITPGPDIEATDEDGQRVVKSWATEISRGPINENGQSLQIQVETDAAHLFAVPPALSTDGTLSFSPLPNTAGTAEVTVRLVDDGGTENGGVNTSPTVRFLLTVSKPHPWHNAKSPPDVDGDGRILPIDAIRVINYLNSPLEKNVPADAAQGPLYYDAAPNNLIAPLDALLVINQLNAGMAAEGETAIPITVDREYAVSRWRVPSRRPSSPILAPSPVPGELQGWRVTVPAHLQPERSAAPWFQLHRKVARTEDALRPRFDLDRFEFMLGVASSLDRDSS
jgi:hypothetical protein